MARSSSVRTTTTRYRTLDTTPCPGCRAALPPDASFCTECGLCLLGGGTVIARAPTPTQPMAVVLEFPNADPEDTVEIDLDDVEVVPEIEEIEIEEIEIEV